MRISTVTSVAAWLFLCSPSSAILTRVNNWGYNPTNLEMNVYYPPNPMESPPVILAVWSDPFLLHRMKILTRHTATLLRWNRT
ncbi:hypothetical protein F5Y11DRAFT_319301 [Daldinia sp. FL1419]|nr:hypothetical protein F5Y11DRAFT_319301 [Daldinia sp. FL1419]